MAEVCRFTSSASPSAWNPSSSTYRNKIINKSKNGPRARNHKKMRPLRFGTATAPYLSGRLLLLNRSLLASRHLSRVLTRGDAAVGRGTLPAELWDRILALVREEDDFVLVEPTLQSETDEVKVVSCREVEFDGDIGGLEDAEMVAQCENRLDPTNVNSKQERDESRKDELPELVTLEATYEVELRADDDGPPCLFTSVTVPDVIARLEDGYCGACGGSRFICPGCGQLPDRFMVFMGCGVELACPLCVGVALAQDHQEFLQANYLEVPDEDQKAMDEEVNDVLRELGYLKE